jgi:regulator of protease activity HflC (stomatin/prohibitin superfamily)
VLGGADLDTLLGERDRLNEALQHVIDAHTEPWGIKVTSVEIKDVEIPERMQHAIARQAEAERERRAKIINAEGEYQAATKLAQAAEVISENPVTIQLRYLQTLREIGAEQNSTVVFPMPIDLIKPVIDAVQRAPGEAGKAPRAPEIPAAENGHELGAGTDVPRELDAGAATDAEPPPAKAKRPRPARLETE